MKSKARSMTRREKGREMEEEDMVVGFEKLLRRFEVPSHQTAI